MELALLPDLWKTPGHAILGESSATTSEAAWMPGCTSISCWQLALSGQARLHSTSLCQSMTAEAWQHAQLTQDPQTGQHLHIGLDAGQGRALKQVDDAVGQRVGRCLLIILTVLISSLGGLSLLGSLLCLP